MKKPWNMEKNQAFAHMLGEMKIFALKNKQSMGIREDFYLTIDQIEGYFHQYASPNN